MRNEIKNITKHNRKLLSSTKRSINMYEKIGHITQLVTMAKRQSNHGALVTYSKDRHWRINTDVYYFVTSPCF